MLSHQPRMMKHYDSIQQILSKFTVKLLASLLPQAQANVTEIHSLCLIDPFEAINERATLNCDAPRVVRHARISREHLRSHCNLQANDISCRPSPSNVQIFSGGGARPRLSVHFHFGAIRPARNSEVDRKLGRLCGHNREVHCAIPRIVCLLTYLQASTIFQMPVELRIVVQMHVMPSLLVL